MDLDSQIEAFQDYYEVDEVIDKETDSDGTVKEHLAKTIRVSLPYNSPDWTGTDVLNCIIRVDNDNYVSIEVVTAPEYIKEAAATSYNCPDKLSDTMTLLHIVDSFYVHLHDTHWPHHGGTGGVRVRDFCYPPYDPRHFGHYPPLHADSLWTEHTVLQAYSGQECRLDVGDKVMVRRPDIIIQDGMLVCRRAQDHLPNNIYSLPNWILKAP